MTVQRLVRWNVELVSGSLPISFTISIPSSKTESRTRNEKWTKRNKINSAEQMRLPIKTLNIRTPPTSILCKCIPTISTLMSGNDQSSNAIYVCRIHWKILGNTNNKLLQTITYKTSDMKCRSNFMLDKCQHNYADIWGVQNAAAKDSPSSSPFAWMNEKYGWNIIWWNNVILI